MSAADAAEWRPVRNRPLIVLTVMLASTLYALDWTIAAVSLPHMQGTFSATQDQISWVLTSYIVVSAITLPTTGWLASRFGRRRLFVAAVTGFTIFSVLCGSADSLAAEVTFRIGQGIAGAFLIPLSQSVMLDVYPREQHAKAMAIWGVGVMMGPIIGPTIGGYLTDAYSWRWVFYINLPAGALAIAGGLFVLPKMPPAAERPPFDWIGFVGLGLGVGAVQMMLDRGQRLDWFESGEIIAEAALAAFGFYLFVVHSLTTRAPLVSPRLFRNRNYVLGLAFIFIYGLLTLGPMVLMPPFLQDLRGYPITTIGLLLSPRGIGMTMAMMLLGRVGPLIDPRVPLLAGFGLLAASSWSMSGWSLEVGIFDVAWTGLFQGVGAGCIVVPLSTLTYATLEARSRTEATAIWNLVRSLGSAMGISIALAVLVRMSTIAQATLTEHVTPFNELLRYPSLAGGWSISGRAALAGFDAEIVRQAAMVGYVDVFYGAAIASALAMPMILLLGRPAAAPEQGDP